MATLPATGSEIAMGRVYKAYSNTTASAGSAVRLSATLGPYRGKTAGTAITLSSTFGAQVTAYAY